MMEPSWAERVRTLLEAGAEVVGVDRYGLDAALTEPTGVRVGRIPFPGPLMTRHAVHRALAAMVSPARTYHDS